jgi:hypothetical protein
MNRAKIYANRRGIRVGSKQLEMVTKNVPAQS